jgi:competence protein ComEC
MQECIDLIEFRSENTNAIIKALLTGNRQDIPEATKEAFRSSGAAHILALSGLHLGIIYVIVSQLSRAAGNSQPAKTFRSLLCICVCTIYSFATGAGASIIRALIFIIIRETGILLHRKTDLKTALAASLVIHLTINPADISSIGFQLSYAAIAGIAWIHPHLSAIWPEDGQHRRIMRRIWESASVSISCQITTGPLAWLYFGTFPQYFILTNIIAIPLTGIIIPAALLTTILNAMGICPHLMIQATEALVDALCGALSIIAAMWSYFSRRNPSEAHTLNSPPSS